MNWSTISPSSAACVGHFCPWEAGEQAAAALEPFLAGHAAATAPTK
jgi:hypothetical protein